MKTMQLLIFLSISLMSFSSFALKRSTTEVKLESEKKNSLMPVGLYGEFGFQSNGLLDDVGDVPGNQHFGSLSIGYERKSTSNNITAFRLRTRVNNENIVEYSLNEGFVEFNYSSSRIAFGRTDLEWSYTDQVWGLGKINNRENFDYFDPRSEGLIGVFYDKKFSNGLDISLFGSGIYVPELSQGLIIDGKSGTVECRTPWCDAPSSSAEIEGQARPIFYDVQYPEVNDVIFRQSVGFKLGYHLDEKFYLNFFQLNKPENSVSVSAEIAAEPDLSEINVEVTPQFYRHDVRGSNVEYNYNKFLKLYASHISIIPNKYPDGDEPFIQYTGIKPKKKREDYLSSGLFYRNADWKGHAGYIARISEFDTESDILVDYPRWNQAIHLNLKKRFTSKIQIGLDLKYDMLTEDRLTMLKADYALNRNIVVALGVNVIGTNKDKESYWGQFENNDSLYSSLNYTF